MYLNNLNLILQKANAYLIKVTVRKILQSQRFNTSLFSSI